MKENFSENHWKLIQDILTNGRQASWFEMAQTFNIKPEGTYSQRRKAANDIWRRFVRLTNKSNIDLITIKQTLNKDGEVVFETKRLLQEVPEIHGSILEGKEIEKITVNPYGKPWVTYKNKNKDISQGLTKEDYVNTIKEYLEQREGFIKEESKEKIFLFKNPFELFSNKTIAVYTSDKHIGASVESNSIYNGEYNKDIFESRMMDLANKIVSLGSAHDLVIFDLGDALDGFNAHTTRGGHRLPQNLSNKEQFKTYLEVHEKFFNRILASDNEYKNIHFIATGNSNHGGDFDYITMKAFEMFLNNLNPFIHTKVTDKFIDHIEVNNQVFIFTHGKDDADMKHGLPLNLNDKVENYINNYIDYHGIDTRKPIHFIKGDLHQSATQYGKRFRYKNVGSIFGSSKWIHTNFGNTKPICDIDIIEENSINEIRLFL